MKQRYLNNLILAILFVLSLNSCKKDEVSGAGTGTITKPYYVTGIIDGDNYTINEGANGYYMIYSNSAESNAPNCSIDYGSGLGGVFTSKDVEVYIDFNLHHQSSGCNDSDEFGALISNGSKSFATPTNSQGVDVAILINGKSYYSSYGSQTGSSFKVTSTNNDPPTPSSFPSSQVSKQVVGEVSCTLYNYNDVSDIITIENMEFSLLYGSYE